VSAARRSKEVGDIDDSVTVYRAGGVVEVVPADTFARAQIEPRRPGPMTRRGRGGIVCAFCASPVRWVVRERGRLLVERPSGRAHNCKSGGYRADRAT
jgi:hypothetical protein